MTIESAIREQRDLIERLWAEDPVQERELAALRETLVKAAAAILDRREEEQASREHVAERQALEALERAAQSCPDDDPDAGIQACLNAVRSSFGPGAAAALVIFDGVGATVVRAFSGELAGEVVDRVGWQVAHKKELIEVAPDDRPVLARSLPLAGARRGALLVSVAERPDGPARRLLETVADRLAHVLDLAERQHHASDEVQRMGEERALRERFVAGLAHDLRGPLIAARISL